MKTHISNDFPTSSSQRKHYYREQGWWTGERLQDRYAEIIMGRGEDLAVVDNRGQRLTHNELWIASGDLADQLWKRGILNRDVIIIFLPNWVEWQVALLGILRAGCIPANLPTRIDEDNLLHVTELTGARAIITSEIHGTTDTGKIACSVSEHCEHRLEVLIFDEKIQDWLVDSEKPCPHASIVNELEHIMFTSSTTGRPKAVMHSADTLAALNITFTERFSLGPQDPIFMASPLGHSVGTIHGARLSLYNGAPLVLQDVWNPVEALNMVAEYGCVFTAASPLKFTKSS